MGFPLKAVLLRRSCSLNTSNYLYPEKRLRLEAAGAHRVNCQHLAQRSSSGSSGGNSGRDGNHSSSTGRRDFLLALTLGLSVQTPWARPSPASAASDAPAAVVQLQLAPDQSLYNAADLRLREAAQLLQRALEAENVQEEEALWSEIIERYGSLDANWVPDLVGRAFGNRGNARSRQGRLAEALADYNASIELCPWSVDPVLNRGVILEALGRFEDAIADYRAVIAAAPSDPAAWNNLGNATAGAGRWSEAVGYYDRAAKLSPQFAFAAANRALALYQSGEQDRAIREMRSLLRKYPDFPDMRAALSAALWGAGEQGPAETEWQRVEDPRYRDREWLKSTRRWPPSLVSAMEDLLDLKG